MEQAIQIFGAIQFLIIGLSHIFAQRAWAEYFLWLRERGHAGVFVIAFTSLAFGSLVVSFHNVWTGIPTALTVIGWAQVFKALVYFCYPDWGLRRLAVVSVERARIFLYPGIFFALLGSLLVYHLLTT